MARNFPGFPQEALDFLRDLKRNNRREWFLNRKDVYLENVRGPMEELILAIADRFEAFAPEMVANLKVSPYRIYRDTRFSPDKSPYKTHAAAVFPRAGLGKHEGAGFYIHVAPEETFVGGGVYRPSRANLQAIREHIGRHHRAFRNVITSRHFRRFFGGISGESLTRIPRGFPPDHPAGDLLRRKQFLASRSLEPALSTTPAFLSEIIRTFQALLPMIRFLNEPLVKLASRSEGPFF